MFCYLSNTSDSLNHMPKALSSQNQVTHISQGRKGGGLISGGARTLPAGQKRTGHSKTHSAELQCQPRPTNPGTTQPVQLIGKNGAICTVTNNQIMLSTTSD